jgi:hypothetical protein
MYIFNLLIIYLKYELIIYLLLIILYCVECLCLSLLMKSSVSCLGNHFQKMWAR